jgi:hypothetical protein
MGNENTLREDARMKKQSKIGQFLDILLSDFKQDISGYGYVLLFAITSIAFTFGAAWLMDIMGFIGDMGFQMNLLVISALYYLGVGATLMQQRNRIKELEKDLKEIL